ncbi:MAG: YabP/YqfC family sporulation protein [Oscillospiraceae bacterium]
MDNSHKLRGAMSKLYKKKLYLNTNINITDNTRVEIENCRRIIEYNDIYVMLSTSTVTVKIWGSNLKISDYNMDGVIIDGKISSLEFE